MSEIVSSASDAPSSPAARAAPALSRLYSRYEVFERTRFGRLTVGGLLIVVGAIAGWGLTGTLDRLFPDPLEEAARTQAALIEDRTSNISLGVQQLQNRLESLGDSPSTSEMAAIQAEAVRLVGELRTISPVVLEAARRNTNIVVGLRQAELDRRGFTQEPAFVLRENEGAEICGGFTVGLNYGGGSLAELRLSRGGSTDFSIVNAGGSVTLTSGGVTATAMLAGRSADEPYRYGINFECSREQGT